MSFTQKMLRRLMCTFIIFSSMNLCYAESITPKFRASNIELVPSLVIMNSTSIVDFICINHQSNDLPLQVNLSKLIPSNQIKLSTNILNKTAIHIRLESKNYVGIFHLLCFSNGEQNKGTRADIIVKAAPGVLQLTERCRVYDRQYIKCVIRAPVIARAIQQDYPAKFEFNEISHPSDHTAYISRFEFLKAESTEEYLAFKWKPTIDGEFPNGVRMSMKAILPYFDAAIYYFDMTPIFQIKPKFTLQAKSSSEIQISFTPISPPAFCEKSIISKLKSTVNQTWTVVESDRNAILINDLLSNTNYNVCMKCRQTYTDPEGIEECQEIKTLSKFSFFSDQKYFIIIISLVSLILLIILIFGFLFLRKKLNNKYAPIGNDNKLTDAIQHRRNTNHYHIGRQSTVPPIVSTNGNIVRLEFETAPDDISVGDVIREDNDEKYIYLAPSEDVIRMCTLGSISTLSET